MKKMFYSLVATLLIAVAFVGCRRPYDTPEYVEVSTSEAAVVIPLFTDGNVSTEDQVAINSSEYYKRNMVSEKLIQIPHKWVQTGRRSWQGKYVPAVKVLKVSTATFSGKWLQGTENAIKVETAGSQGVTIPITYTFCIKPEDVPLFLASNNGSSDIKFAFSEMVNKFFAKYCGREFHKYEYSEVNSKRDEIIDAAVDETIIFAKERGITIITMGVFDGLIFDDNSLQESIDKQAKIAAQVQEEKQKQVLLETERKNKLYEEETKKQAEIIAAQKEREVANLKAATMQTLKVQQDIENSKILAQAEADAIRKRAEKGAPGANATTFVINDSSLQSLGLGDLMKR